MSKSKNNAIQRILAILLLLFVPLFFVKEYKTLIFRKKFISNMHGDIVIHSNKSDQKAFVVFIVSDDDSPFSEKSLCSVMDQKYPNYKVAFIDTSSSLVNLQKAKKIARKFGIEKDVLFFRTAEVKEFESVYYKALKNYKDDEIVVHLEASDWFVNPYVLEKLNEIYKDPDVWLTYSEYQEPSKIQFRKEDFSLRTKKGSTSGLQAPWLISHLKTFYVGLIRQVDLGTVSTKGSNHDTEKIIMKALMQLSKWHIRFIPEILYVHNEESIEAKSRAWKISDFFLEHFKTRNTSRKQDFYPPKRMGS